MTHITTIRRPHQRSGFRYFLQVSAMCLAEARPTVLGIFLLRFLVGAAMHTGTVRPEQIARLIAAALVWELAVFAAYLFNGIMDVHEDRINGSRRPIAQGSLPVELAARIAAGAALLAIIAGIGLGTEFAVTVVALLILGWLYSGPPTYLKRRTLGTPITCTAYGFLTYYAGSIAVVGDAWERSNTTLHIFAGAMALWMGLVGVPAKDLSDVAGDAAAGRRTLPVVCGDATVRYAISVTACLLAVIFCSISVSSALPLIWPNVVMLGGAAAMTAVTLSRFSRADRSQLRRPFRAFMATQYLANLSVLTPATAPLLLSG